MGDKSHIEWTDATLNTVSGCTKVSPGCDNCYIETTPPFRMAGRKFTGDPGHIPLVFHEDRLQLPLRWTSPRRIFVNSLSDLFHKDVPDAHIARLWATMAVTPQHTYQILTKRPGRMRSLVGSDKFARLVDAELEKLGYRGWLDSVLEWPLPNVWLGVTVENQRWADVRIPQLLRTPAAVRFLSCEPLLGPVTIDRAVPSQFMAPGQPSVDWVIAGGESGPRARPMHPTWVLWLRDQCVGTGVAFHFKQAGNVLAKEWGCTGKGTDPAEWPETFPREYPTGVTV